MTEKPIGQTKRDNLSLLMEKIRTIIYSSIADLIICNNTLVQNSKKKKDKKLNQNTVLECATKGKTKKRSCLGLRYKCIGFNRHITIGI